MIQNSRLSVAGCRAAFVGCGSALWGVRLCGWLWAMGGLLSTAWAQPVPDRDTLLLANFDGGVNADFARGTPTGWGRANLAPGRFGHGVCLEAGRTVSFVGNDGNFHAPSGTIEFWIKPNWSGDEAARHAVFTCRFGAKGYININSLGRGRFGIAISSGEGKQWRWRRADADVSDWKPHQWHHVACVWGAGRLQVFVDGQLGKRSSQDARMPDALPQTLDLGAADAVVDGFRISRRAYTADDVRRSIEAALKRPPFRHVEDLLAASGGPTPRFRRTLVGNIRLPLMIGSSVFTKGFVSRPDHPVTVPLRGEFDALKAEVGVEAFSDPSDRCIFVVKGDGKTLFESRPLKREDGPQPISVSLRGVKELELGARAVGRTSATTLTAWANAVVMRRDADVVVPPPHPAKAEIVKMYRRQVNADRYDFSLPPEPALHVAAKFWEDDLDPSKPPTADRIGAKLTAFATPGEYEPLCFVVYATQDLCDVHVT
ncbi:MAG TPA: hypothetical protein EYP14_17615, partial [Planctomycetaceae bacterium]|nr:hypothetical protein [Planctomycetaceae bacterium]